MQKIIFGVILPHCQLFGGIRRFFELGEIFVREGHEMIILTPEGKAPAWFDSSCKIDKLENIGQYSFSALFTTEPLFLDSLLKGNAKNKIFYHVGPRASLKDILKHKEVTVFVNSTNMLLFDKKKYGIDAVRAFGGVHIPADIKIIDKNKEPFVIMCYGRLSRRGKGTHIVVKAAEKLYKKGYNIKLLLFDSPIDEKSKNLIQKFTSIVPHEFILNHPVKENDILFKKADVFVAVEKKGGWSNTAAEAMAAGVPVIASNTGTRDFVIHNETGLKVFRHSYFVANALIKLINDIQLRQKLATNGREKMKDFSWEQLAHYIIEYVKDRPSAI